MVYQYPSVLIFPLKPPTSSCLLVSFPTFFRLSSRGKKRKEKGKGRELKVS
jgi:hypothetical protein